MPEWWFLFSKHCITIGLANKIFISWDGAVVDHCSSVPVVDEGDQLLSLFTARPKNLVGVLRHEKICKSIVS